ncbi:hypothetical protein BAE44_0014725 [Dichanthelium oligosanthes]|uniref:F-box domain-containing protein n=1 Tax=Dichanthelium oligosanthes TaxID=888268 RepID=A0A1E5VGK3_9POAL|nr:hypothetical protein BAE44_0014725 [Dichanthelium oligosanthes]
METSPPRRRQRLSSPEPTAEAATPSLDSLPPEILEKVVSCLRLCDAVRTSALSRACRRRCESSPGIRFSWGFSSDAPPAGIDAVLARYACPVGDFSYWEIPKEAFAHTDEWIRVLAGKGVKSLTLRFREYIHVEIHTLNPAVFSCRELTHLTLHDCFLPTAPSSFAGFPKLTWLSLTMVGFHEHGETDLEAMIQMSLLLETLELKDVRILGDEVIQESNLRHLTFVADDDYELQIGELLSLQKANVSIENYYSFDRDFVKFLTHFAHVRELEFHIQLAVVNVLEGLSCSFQILKSLVLHTDFCNVSRILSMFSLLRSAPNLQQLETKIVDTETQNDEVDIDFFSALCTNSVFTKLKIVTVTGTPLWSNEMHFIEFILSKARLLCALFVYQDDDSDHSKPSEEAVI